MQVRTVRKPGERGTQRLVDQYGERLVCVRYRYDPQKLKRYKTVELIIAEESWIPEPAARVDDAPSAVKHRYTPRVPVRIRYHEKELAASDQSDRWHVGAGKETLVRTGRVRAKDRTR